MKFIKAIKTDTKGKVVIKYKNVLFKDKESINHRNLEEYIGNIWLLAGALRSNEGSFLCDPSFFNRITKRKSNHSGCEQIKTVADGQTITEKRICRCMKYYDKNSSVCQGCYLKKKWNNVGNYKVVDYEVPTEIVVDSVGGIDLLLEDKEGNKYATELKVENSKETLVRMMAETLTYTSLGREKYKPAICFFKNSIQWKDFCSEEFQKDSAFQYLLTFIEVFYITYEENNGIVNYTILNNRLNPLC